MCNNTRQARRGFNRGGELIIATPESGVPTCQYIFSLADVQGKRVESIKGNNDNSWATQLAKKKTLFRIKFMDRLSNYSLF